VVSVYNNPFEGQDSLSILWVREELYMHDEFDDSDDTNPDSAPTQTEVDALKDELETIHGGDIKIAAQTLLEEKALQAIIGIAKIAKTGTHEQTRFAAQKYIVERVLGPLNKIEPSPDVNHDPLVRMLIKAKIIDVDDA
jgi:hypothetical protein